MTDETLMHAGDFETLFGRYREPLTNYCRSREPDAADDVVQAVCLRVVKYRDKFTPGMLYRPWVYAMADRLCRSHRKQQQRERAKFAEYVASGLAAV
jgi:DNA-directed RNA polymerase specialized sigma24 family protein